MLGPFMRASNLRSTGASLKSTPGAGTPTRPANPFGPIGAQHEGRGLGHAEARHHENALAHRLQCQLVERVPDELRQARRGIEHHLHALEERFAQFLVGAQERNQEFVCLGTLK